MPLIVKNDPSYEAVHKAFDYQHDAMEEIKDLDYAAIFHEQGLGKTKIAIDLLLYWLKYSVVDSVILVVKKGLIANWKKEFAQHTNIRPRLLSQDRSANYHALNSPARVYLVHFEAIRSEEKRIKLFLKTRRVAVIIDESQKLKNPKATLTQSFMTLAPLFEKRVIMTGTPVANRPYDIWSQIFFLDQGQSLGGNYEEFKKNHDFDSNLANDIGLQDKFRQRLGIIFERISDFTVRETKNGAGIVLPEKEIIRIYVDWETIQFELYSQIRKELRAVIIKNGVPVVDNAEELLKRLVRLLQIASNPRLVDESYQNYPGKFEVLDDLLDAVVDKDEKAIVWTSFTQNADWLTRELKKFGTSKIHGKMAIEDRNRSIEKFLTDSETRVLVATPGAAKEGLTLTVANHVIFYDRSFSLDDYLQAQDRIHRISQTRTCFVYNFVMKNSIDEWVDVLLREKELAAKLAQGDLTEDEYKNEATFNMFDMLNSVLS